MMNTKINEDNRRVVITGMGQISSLGMTLESLQKAIYGGTAGVRPLTGWGEGELPVSFCSEAASFTGDIADFGDMDASLKKTVRKSLKLMSREIQMGVAAAERALQQAQVTEGTFDPPRAGVSFAADYIMTTTEELTDGALACTENGIFDFSKWGGTGMPKMTPIWQLKFLPNMPTSHLSILNSFHGPGFNATCREASVGVTVGEGYQVIRSGRADAMLVGATGSLIHPKKMIAAVENEETADRTLVPERASRPFDRDRTGMVLGEGAGALFLESLESALSRNVPILAEVAAASTHTVLSRGNTADGSEFFNFSRENGIASYILTLKSLFKRANLDPASIGHLCANGLGTRQGDAVEAQAIRQFFGDAADRLPVTTTKGHLGNIGAGGGIIDLIASVMAMESGNLYPILNNENDDADCPIRPVRDFEAAGDSFVKLAGQKYGQTSAVLIRKFV